MTDDRCGDPEVPAWQVKTTFLGEDESALGLVLPRFGDVASATPCGARGFLFKCL